MTRLAFARELESASDAIGDISRADLAIMLRRAAIRLRNVGGIDLEPRTDDALATIATELAIPKGDLVAQIVREWLEANAYLPVPYALGNESVTEGNA
ncbi:MULTISPECIES: hypothetical protein [unclassified Mesorhizobium]|uniref:hypothetical protein n=1 Tax=unclassified Mesorhizobium TaxID=325217 RepID=UPI001093D277|nr:MULTISPECIES: hypothetical protein [unclassified Mesorhizobium]TGT91725.1 hypothetical protein EN804_01235 [Mesorhizobium sp. M8A.F.Ca.ET.161.01.1.1]TGV44751.1 hypothetical protein EN785_01230 [Mesorhizobium sp. M8A.F.Ca.ET.142.01.1.1]TGW05084.1 hypothetical protein EN788_49345 [Mesorhizobium sp. M2D.F.Ca.ET.145.01.1.1]